MKKHCIYLILVVQILVLGELKGQTKFTNYFCELDTQFNGSEFIAKQTLVKKSLWSSGHNGIGLVQLKGVTQGMAINRSSNFKYYNSNNVKTFTSASAFSTHNVDSLGYKYSYIYKSDLEFNIGEDMKIMAGNTIQFAQSLNPSPLQLGRIVLGTTNFQSSGNRGNFFFAEQFVTGNNQIANWKRDTTLNNFTGIFPETFSNDKTNYKSLISGVNRYELTGWLIEMDRISSTFQNRRFDLGRAPRKDFLLNTIRNSSTLTTATVDRSFQILGYDDLNILLKTELNNSIQEFFVYTEEKNSFGSNWTLLNKVSGGSIQPLEREVLLDLFGYVVKNPQLTVTYFLNLTDVEINDITNTILLVSPGGNVNIDEFKSRNGISHDLVLATYMTPLLINTSVSDKLGHLLELDENDKLTSTRQGIISDNGKFISNVEYVSFHNLSYIDDNSEPQNTSYAILSENIFDNTLGQNPKHIKLPSDFQNEVYLVNLDGLSNSNSTINFGSRKFELFHTLAKGSHIIPVKYTEAYHPSIYLEINNTKMVDSLCGIRGFADFYINPVVCDKQNDVEEVLTTENKNYVYPNPLRLESGFGIIKWKELDIVHIYTMQGAHIGFSDYGTEMDLNDMKSGTYLVRGEKGWNQILIID